MPKISVIIPVYNSAKWITACVDSVLAQTMTEYECILVDNCGQDDSIAQVRHHLKGKPEEGQFVFAATETNNGPGAARNLGLSMAKGKYVAFLDADDFVEPEMYKVLYENAECWDADISSAAAVLDYEDGRENSFMYNPHVGNGEITPSNRKILLNRFVSNFTTCLFRRDWLIHSGIIFPDSRSGEDSAFMGCCYLSASRIAQTDEVFYHYRIHAESISHKKRMWRGAEKRKAFDAMFQYARNKGLMREYWWQLYSIYRRKALLTPIIEVLK